MITATKEKQFPAACCQCGRVHAAIELANGKIQPVGGEVTCRVCGNEEFEPVSTSAIAPVREDPVQDRYKQ